VVVSICLFFEKNKSVEAQEDKKEFRLVVMMSRAEAKICRPVPREMNTAAIITITS
jgi:hypothetical protein